VLVTEAAARAFRTGAEAGAGPDTAPPIRTAQYTAMVCTDPSMPGTAACPLNTIDLTPLGAAGSIEFTVQQISGGIYVQQLKAKAGADGLYIEHPLLESYAGGAEPAIPDPTDRFFATALNIMPNMEATFGLAYRPPTSSPPHATTTSRRDSRKYRRKQRRKKSTGPMSDTAGLAA